MDVHVGGKKAHERYLMMRQRVEASVQSLEFVGRMEFRILIISMRSVLRISDIDHPKSF